MMRRAGVSDARGGAETFPMYRFRDRMPDDVFMSGDPENEKERITDMTAYRIDTDTGARPTRPPRPGHARSNHWTLSPTFGRALLARTLAASLAVAFGFETAMAQRPDTIVLPIGRVQGDTSGLIENGFPSPLAGEVVTVQGVVYLPLIRFGRRGVLEYGFFIQNTPDPGSISSAPT